MLGFATSYPFLNILWDILITFAWVIFIWIAITALIDLYRRHDESGWGKAAWTVFIVLIPWIGVLCYLIANHQGMAERRRGVRHSGEVGDGVAGEQTEQDEVQGDGDEYRRDCEHQPLDDVVGTAHAGSLTSRKGPPLRPDARRPYSPWTAG